MGIQTVVEYVEDQATVDALKELGVDYGQGNHFAAAQPLAMLCKKLAAQSCEKDPQVDGSAILPSLLN